MSYSLAAMACTSSYLLCIRQDQAECSLRPEAPSCGIVQTMAGHLGSGLHRMLYYNMALPTLAEQFQLCIKLVLHDNCYLH